MPKAPRTLDIWDRYVLDMLDPGHVLDILGVFCRSWMYPGSCMCPGYAGLYWIPRIRNPGYQGSWILDICQLTGYPGSCFLDTEGTQDAQDP